MIILDLKQIEEIDKIKEELTIIQKFIEEITEEPFIKKQVIVNESIKANFLEYHTKKEIDRVWEAHKKDIDIHYILTGEEVVSLSDHLIAEEYHEEEDYYLLRGDSERKIKLRKNQLLIFFPDEAHKTAGQVDNHDVLIQKIVFKVRKNKVM